MNDSLSEFLAEEQDGFYFIGHASALARLNKKLFLVDPVWGDYQPYGKWWKFYPEQVNCEELLPLVEGIFVSHIHADHMCLPILERAEAPIYIIKGRPELTEKLKACKIVVEVEPLKWIGDSNDVQIYFIPHAYNTVDSAIALRSKDFTLYTGNDCFLSAEQCEAIKPDFPKIDVALVPYAFIHYYPMLLDSLNPKDKENEARRLSKQSLDQALSFVKIMKPVSTVPFGSSLFYNDGPKNPLNKFVLSPFEFPEAIPLTAGGYIMADGYQSQPLSNYDYFEGLEKAIRSENTERDYRRVLITTEDISRLLNKVQKATFTVPNHEIIVNGLVIDTETLNVRTSPTGVPTTNFIFEPDQFEQWLHGKITFEEALGTRRFVYLRTPNEYKLPVVEWYSKFL